MKYICVHGHFYQPPRENPWLEAVEVQDSAFPYHDWNERVTAECYAANARSRVLDGDNRITEIVNNYAKISFNFGPTLLSWLENNAPKVYAAILEADRESVRTYSGQGSALAQAYNHMIMPLANDADRYTQARWGKRDFRRRFGRQPVGMWLPETAVDIPSLEVLAKLGIKFTILAPRQAAKTRKIGTRAWKDVSGEQIDPTMAYRCRLPSGRTMALFFYDGPISKAVAFEGLLNDGVRFAERLVSGFSDARTWPQLVHIATDGESYGHHHRHGEMALTYALRHIESNQLAKLTNYAEFLGQHPPAQEVQIFENSSWSCVHGIERWRSNCGCNSGREGWNQEWRGALRAALDWLRDALIPLYEGKAGALLKDPWAARNDYIDVVLDRSSENIDRFLSKHATRSLNQQEQVTALKLLEMQRHAMLMYTSCGWFFDEISGIETVQVIAYAARAIHLVQDIFADHLESGFLERLAQAKSNLPEHGDGAQIYRKWIKPAVISLQTVGAHYAISSLFESYGDQAQIYCYTVKCKKYARQDSGNTRLAIGRGIFCSNVTRESRELSYGVVLFGDHNIDGGVRDFQGEEPYDAMTAEVSSAFARADIPEVIRIVDKVFGTGVYSLKSLFRDEQRKIVDQILKPTVNDAEATSAHIYEQHAPLMRFLATLNMPLPRIFRAAAEFALNRSLREAIAAQHLDAGRIRALIKEAGAVKAPLDVSALEFDLRKRIEHEAETLCADPSNLAAMMQFNTMVELGHEDPFHVTFDTVQNICYEKLIPLHREFRGRAEKSDQNAQEWVRLLQELTEKLSLRVG